MLFGKRRPPKGPNRRSSAHSRRPSIEQLQNRELLASDLELVKDINAQPDGDVPELVAVGDHVFFARISTAGPELWKSDGTADGVQRVKLIAPLFVGSSLRYLTNVNGTLFFSVADGTSGLELWKSDGTEAGTVLVKDIQPGAGSSYPKDLTNVNGTLFFSANDGVHGEELWKSDGTEAGTVLVKDIAAALLTDPIQAN